MGGSGDGIPKGQKWLSQSSLCFGVGEKEGPERWEAREGRTWLCPLVRSLAVRTLTDGSWGRRSWCDLTGKRRAQETVAVTR